MAKQILKEKWQLADNIKSKEMESTSKGGSDMNNNNANIFEKKKIIEKMNEIKESLGDRVYKAKRVILKGISLGTALSIIMSSVAFGGEHTVDNWKDFKNAIVQDIIKQDSEIIIYYQGEDKFSTKEEISNKLRELFDEILEEGYSTFESQNYFSKKTGGEVKTNEDGTYSLSKGTYTVTYKNSKEELEEVEAIIDSFIEENIDDSMSDYDKVKAIYDFIIDSYVYGYQRTCDDDIEGALRERNILLGLDGEEVVCDAFAMLFSKMATRLGYNNMIINGKADGISHAWNLIEIDGQWYHVDATWGNVDIEEEIEKLKKDNPDLDESIIREVVENHAKEKREKYLLTSDSVIAEKHSWDEGKYPSAPESYNIGDAVEKEIRNQINAINDSIQMLNTNVYEIEDIINAIENVTQIQNLREEIQQYYEDIDSIRSQIDTIRENMQELEEDTIDELEHDLAQLELFLDELKAGLDDASVLLDEKEIEIQNQLIQQAIDAVVLAETTKSQANVDAARELVSYLPEIEIKNSLLQRLDVVQAEIDIQNLISIIEEQIINLTDINNSNEIQEAINTLPEGEEKDRLQRQLNSKIEELEAQEELNRQIQEAIEAVELAERTKTQEDVDFARDIVNQLPDCPEKDDLLERIDIIENKINTPEEPQEPEEPSEDEENDEEEEPEDPEEPEEPTDEEDEENDEEESSDEEEQNEEEPQEPEEPSDGEDEEDEQDEEEPIDEEDEQNQENPEEPLDEEEQEDKENSSDDEEPSEDEEPVDDNEDEEEEQNEEDEENEQDEEADEPENPSDEEQEEQEDEDNEQDEEQPSDEEDEEPSNEEPSDNEQNDEEGLEDDKEQDEDDEQDEQPIDEDEQENDEQDEEGNQGPTDEEDKEEQDHQKDKDKDKDKNKDKDKHKDKNEDKNKDKNEKDDKTNNDDSKETDSTISSIEKIKEINTILKVLPNINAKIIVKDKTIKPDVKPYIYKAQEEKVLVPIRFVAEALGFDVNWSKATWHQGIRKVYLSKNGKGIVMEIGENLAYINGVPAAMDFAPELKDGRTYVSLDFIVEVLETSFSYNYNNGEIIFNIDIE